MTRTTLIAAAVTAVLPLSMTATVAQADTAERKAGYVVTAKINRTVAIADEDVVKIRGRVTPKAAGEVVILQQRLEGKKRWKKSGEARIKSDGRYKVTDDPSSAGTRFYRILKPASDGIGRGVSDELELEVWAWGPLTSRAAGANQNVTTTGVQIGTESFNRSLSLISPGPGYIEYTLGNKCSLLRATYALRDDSESGATGLSTVTADGTALITHELAIGTVVKDHELDMTEVFRLRFDLSSSTTPKGYTAVGNPEVLCTK